MSEKGKLWLILRMWEEVTLLKTGRYFYFVKSFFPPLFVVVFLQVCVSFFLHICVIFQLLGVQRNFPDKETCLFLGKSIKIRWGPNLFKSGDDDKWSPAALWTCHLFHPRLKVHLYLTLVMICIFYKSCFSCWRLINQYILRDKFNQTLT